MPYKDKETQKKAQREWVRQKRDKGKKLTLEIAKEIEMSTPTVDNVDYNFTVPERAKVLPPEVIKGILACLRERANVAKIFGVKHALPDDSSARWDRAITYHNWRLSYKPVKLDKPASDNSTFMH